jgi:hypothetical protein
MLDLSRERDALRYLAGDVLGIAVSYHNLGNYLQDHARRPAPALACHLAAAPPGPAPAPVETSAPPGTTVASPE